MHALTSPPLAKRIHQKIWLGPSQKLFTCFQTNYTSGSRHFGMKKESLICPETDQISASRRFGMTKAMGTSINSRIQSSSPYTVELPRPRQKVGRELHTLQEGVKEKSRPTLLRFRARCCKLLTSTVCISGLVPQLTRSSQQEVLLRQVAPSSRLHGSRHSARARRHDSFFLKTPPVVYPPDVWASLLEYGSRRDDKRGASKARAISPMPALSDCS